MALAEAEMAQLRKLTEVSRKLTYACSTSEILTLAVERAAELLDADRAMLVFMDEKGLFGLRASHGLTPSHLDEFHAPLEDVIERLQSVLGLERFLGVPLVIGGMVVGVLAVSRTPPSDGSDEREEWLLSALADQAAVAIERTQAEEAGNLRERLVGIVGHDLRNPIAAISSAATLLLRKGTLGDKETQWVERISRSANHMGQLIKQMLDFTHLRLGGGLPLNTGECDLLEIVSDVVDELQVVHPTRAIGLTTDRIGSARGVWDRDRIAQLISNLIGNAIHHGAPDQPVSVRLQRADADLMVSVHNVGEPIPLETIPGLFDPFRRGRSPALRPKSATSLGLGLFIVQSIAKGHGGAITVDSSELEGTTFSVRLPQAPLAPDRDREAPTGHDPSSSIGT